MHISPPWIAITATLIPSATAFYPYQYGDDSSPSKSLRTLPPSTNANTNARSVTLPLRRISSLNSRQNTYNIVNSKDPSQPNSVAIDQDGGDISYMVGLTIGDSKTEYHLLLDSAASNTWVMGKDCSTDACKTHNTFGKGDSGSLKTQNTPFSVAYGTGSVSGTLATDTFHIGTLSPSITFGLANNVSSEFSSYPMDGILGIGRGAKNVQGSIAAPQIMDVLSNSKLIGAKLYGIHLSRGTDGQNDGELNLGSVNKDRFSGDLTYADTVPNDTGFWEVPLDNAGVDGRSLDLTGRSAIIDTGTSFILVPSADAVKIHSQIQGYVQDGETFSVPCTTTSIIQFTINKQSFNISTADWRGPKIPSGLCRSNIIGRQTFGEKQWLVGDVFLKNVYSVFDFDKNRVGFGVKKAETLNAPGSSSSATTVSSATSASGTAKVSADTGLIVGGAAVSSTLAGARASPTASADKANGQKNGGGYLDSHLPTVVCGVLGALLFV